MTKTRNPRRMARPPEISAEANPPPVETPTSAASAAVPKRVTKHDLVLELLQREGGAPLNGIVEATGWLPHTARAALTGLRKKGHAITRSKVEGETRYATTAVAAQ